MNPYLNEIRALNEERMVIWWPSRRSYGGHVVAILVAGVLAAVLVGCGL